MLGDVGPPTLMKLSESASALATSKCKAVSSCPKGLHTVSKALLTAAKQDFNSGRWQGCSNGKPAIKARQQEQCQASMNAAIISFQSRGEATHSCNLHQQMGPVNYRHTYSA
jgi:hypothetical protein